MSARLSCEDAWDHRCESIDAQADAELLDVVAALEALPDSVVNALRAIHPDWYRAVQSQWHATRVAELHKEADRVD